MSDEEFNERKAAEFLYKSILRDLHVLEAAVSLIIYRLVGDNEGKTINLNTLKAAVKYIDTFDGFEVPIPTPVNGGAVFFESVKTGKVVAIATEKGDTLTDTYKIKKYMENL